MRPRIFLRISRQSANDMLSAWRQGVIELPQATVNRALVATGDLCADHLTLSAAGVFDYRTGQTNLIPIIAEDFYRGGREPTC